VNTRSPTLRSIGSHPVLGQLYPDMVGNMLGTGFCRFEGKDFDGLCRESGGCLDILAIISKNPGQGKFRMFVVALQSRYRAIRFYEVMNDGLYTHLSSSGFNDFDEWGVTGPNVIWESKTP